MRARRRIELHEIQFASESRKNHLNVFQATAVQHQEAVGLRHSPHTNAGSVFFPSHVTVAAPGHYEERI